MQSRVGHGILCFISYSHLPVFQTLANIQTFYNKKSPRVIDLLSFLDVSAIVAMGELLVFSGKGTDVSVTVLDVEGSKKDVDAGGILAVVDVEGGSVVVEYVDLVAPECVSESLLVTVDEDPVVETVKAGTIVIKDVLDLVVVAV